MTMVESSVEQFAGGLRGQLIQQGNAEYEEARHVMNGMIDRRPRVIVRCADVADVMNCVNFAREEGLVLSIRGGGHNIAGFGTNDGGLVIDLGRMKGIRVDAANRTVRAQGGCTWGDVDHATHPFGLAAAGGVVSTTGIGGLSLGGGMGHLTRPFGLACDNLVSADVVTADGQCVVANEKENADLYWALRGGGGNFGVVTSFEFRLHPVGIIYGGPILWPIERTEEAMKFYREFIANAPNEVNVIFGLLMVPPAEPFPEHLHGKNVCGAIVCCVAPLDKAESLVQHLKEFGPPIMDGTGPIPFPMLQQAFDDMSPPGILDYEKGDFAAELSDELVASHAKFGADVPNFLSGTLIFPINGAAHQLGKIDTAWSYRDVNFSQVIFGLDDDPSAMPQRIEWVRAYYNAIHPHSAGGSYVNFLMDEGDDRIRASYRDNYSRLAEIKRKYDSGNLFRMNQNIKP